MLTNDNVRYLIDLGNRYSTDAIRAIRADKIMDKQDKSDMIDVVMNNDIEAFWKLDTVVRDHLLDALKEEFNFLDYDELMQLSEDILSYQDYLKNMQKSICNIKIAKDIDIEVKRLANINSKLCRYADRIKYN